MAFHFSPSTHADKKVRALYDKQKTAMHLWHSGLDHFSEEEEAEYSHDNDYDVFDEVKNSWCC